ncbi:MAG: flagellar basal body rod modification protein [Boseongicola sp.]|nr:MAG: flagellar basal body rod modification protein [Boseongicola sp.]
MEIQNQVTQSTPIGAPQRPETASNALSSDFETFLKMLTTQMENQDPLNPMESSDFAVQLATFSGVEQQIQTNGLLRDMVAGAGASGLAQLAGWVGMEAKVAGPVQFDGTPLSLTPETDPASDAAYLIVTDESGRVVSREGLPVNSGEVLWAGVGDDGSPLPPGQYNFEVESVNQNTITSTRPVEHYALVREARLGEAGVDIILTGGHRVPSADITALRAPSGNFEI